MTWSINAMGHTPAPEGASDWADVEAELYDRLAEIFRDPKYGTSTSRFVGNYVNGPIHVEGE